MISKFPMNLPNYGFGFIYLIQKYGPAKGAVLIALHKRLGSLLDAMPPRRKTNPVAMDYEDLRALHNLYVWQVYGAEPISEDAWGLGPDHPSSSLDTVSLCRWALAQGLIEEYQFIGTRDSMRM